MPGDEYILVAVLRHCIRAEQASGVKLRDLGSAAGVSQSQISRFQRGKTLTLDSAAKLFDHFKLRVQMQDGTTASFEAISSPPPPPAPASRTTAKKPRKR